MGWSYGGEEGAGGGEREEAGKEEIGEEKEIVILRSLNRNSAISLFRLTFNAFLFIVTSFKSL